MVFLKVVGMVVDKAAIIGRQRVVSIREWLVVMKDELMVVMKVASKAGTMVALKAVSWYAFMEFLEVD